MPRIAQMESDRSCIARLLCLGIWSYGLLCRGLSYVQTITELELMFKLMDRVDDGVLPMLHDLQSHIKEAGLSDMHACADVITTVSDIMPFSID